MSQPPAASWTPEPLPRPERPPEPPRPARRRRWPWVLGVLAAVLVVLLALGAWYAVSLARTFDDHRQTVDAGALEQADGGEPVNVLVLGSDSRGEEGEEDMGERSDAMMLVHLPADRSQMFVMSVLRDSWVEIPGHGEAKVNAALDLGGYPLAVDTVEQLLGVPVHHVVEVDFQGFRGVTNALGGVEVCNPVAFSSGQTSPSYYPRGPVLLQDTAALRYVRERHAFDDGDVSRVQNQQRYLAGAMERFLSPQILGNPARTTEVVATFSDHLGVDAGLTSGVVASLAWQLRGVRAGDVEMFTVPRAGFGYSPDGDSIVELDEAKLADLRSALKDDDVQRYVAEHESEDTEETEASVAEAAGAVPAPVLALLAQPAPTPAVGEDPCAD
ncbi:LCP family protein [Micrococcus endophyticus]|uniref:LCP family protein n=1 Tax=Micrococcus endophyticus TaxID=455343 RepID=UPI0034CEF59E